MKIFICRDPTSLQRTEALAHRLRLDRPGDSGVAPGSSETETQRQIGAAAGRLRRRRESLSAREAGARAGTRGSPASLAVGERVERLAASPLAAADAGAAHEVEDGQERHAVLVLRLEPEAFVLPAEAVVGRRPSRVERLLDPPH